MGILMGLGSAALFGLGAICVKIGMRRQPIDNGHFMSVLVNVLALGLLLLFTTLPSWNWTGFGGFILAGVMTTFLGRGSSFTAIRLIGPSRQSAILVSAPLFAAITGWIFLEEGITLLQAVGGGVVSLGLLLLVRTRMEEEDEPAEISDGALVVSAQGQVVLSRRQRARTAIRSDPFVRGFLISIFSAVVFGAGFVARKWSLSYYPSAVAGAFFGAATALTLIMLRAAGAGRVRHLVDSNLRVLPWWFVGGGVASSIALLLQFNAFAYLPAWIVSLLQGTQAVWALVWAALFLRHEEQIGPELIVSVALVVCGVAIMTYGL